MQWYSSMQILPLHRVLVTIASHFLTFPPQSPTCNSSHQCIPSLSQSSCHDCKSFSKLPPPKALHTMVFLNAHPSLSQSSCHDCKSFSKLPPPKALHAMVVLNAHPSLSQSSCHDCKSFSKLPPPKALHAMVVLNANPSLA